MSVESSRTPWQYELTFNSPGIIGERVGSGRHSVVSKILPFYPGLCLDPSKEYVFKEPTKLLYAMSRVGYNYLEELHVSKHVLSAAQRVGIPIQYAPILYNDGKRNTSYIQEFIPGPHPCSTYVGFEPLLAHILTMNRELYQRFGATFDMQHILESYLCNGPNAPISLDNFKYDPEYDFILTDPQLTKILPGDNWAIRKYKCNLLKAECRFFDKVYGMQFI